MESNPFKAICVHPLSFLSLVFVNKFTIVLLCAPCSMVSGYYDSIGCLTWLYQIGKTVLHLNKSISDPVTCDPVLGGFHIWYFPLYLSLPLHQNTVLAILATPKHYTWSHLATPGHHLTTGHNLATPGHTWQHLVTTKWQHPDPNNDLYSGATYEIWISRPFFSQTDLRIELIDLDYPCSHVSLAPRCHYRGCQILWLSACDTFVCMFHQFAMLCFELE